MLTKQEFINLILNNANLKTELINNFKKVTDVDYMLKCLENNILNFETKESLTFECSIWISKETNEYLIETRLFNDKTNGNMVAAYLQVYNSDMVIIRNIEDCVWDYTNWSKI